MKLSEAETVIKRILPYLVRRGYDVDKDMTFEDPVKIGATGRQGFIDIVITCGRKNPVFLIEAKRDGTKIAAKHRAQAIEYGQSLKVLLVATTNGQVFELLNAKTGKPLQLNGKALDRIPSKTDLLGKVIGQLKSNPECGNLTLPTDRALPYRPGLPATKLNHLIKQCHNSIRKIEKNEEHTFADFSKLMFLKLLEEKWDQEAVDPPYSFTFHEMADYPRGKGDQIKTAVQSMIQTIRQKTAYGSVLDDPIHLKKDATYQSIVKRVASVSFSDCDLDSKGAAFEYFVRATLKGKRLGQYFTPRPLVKLMLGLGHWKQIIAALAAGGDFKVLDPACGTGGFLVMAMNQCVEDIERRLKAREVHHATADALVQRVKQDVFYGIDAHEGVACSAKMNMIIAGDGYNNIRCEDTLNEAKLIPPYQTAKGTECDDGKAHLILTNPPFGTAEGETLTEASASMYSVPSTRGQSLFIQQMIRSAHSDSLIVTVIDEGVLNTASHAELRRYILKMCRVEAVLDLPEETFKPNKINVKASVLVLRRRSPDHEDPDYSDDYPVACVSVKSLGYQGSGDEIRGYDLERLIDEIQDIKPSDLNAWKTKKGYQWSAFRVQSKMIAADKTARMDVRFWHPRVRSLLKSLARSPSVKTIKKLNTIETRRGKSPPLAEYVSESEGHALVVKSGSNISKIGELIVRGDYIEQSLYQDYIAKKLTLEDGDVLLASTGDGTIGKCCVYRNSDDKGQARPAVPEGHVTVIRVNQDEVWPEYLCDYLRKAFGHDQLYRLYTGTTGMVEVTPNDVNEVLVPITLSVPEQKVASEALRKSEREAVALAGQSADVARAGEQAFRQTTLPATEHGTPNSTSG